MNTSDLILILLKNKNLPGRNKFFSIVEIIVSSLNDKYFFIFPEKAEQQISSEVLYLFEKYEKSKRATRAWITTRLNLLKKTLLEQGLIRLRTAFEVGIDFIQDLSFPEKDILSLSEMDNSSCSEIDNFSSSELPDEKKQKKRSVPRTRGWQEKTYQKFERFVLNRSSSPKKIREIEVLPLKRAV